ncbi:hypothetical protein [Escherichia coli]|uniref:hypothetical protein n=1 Tax=Escherichia coli TaxID=562 RepID=UPI00386027E7
MFSHPVYLFLRKFSLQDSRGGSDQSTMENGRTLCVYSNNIYTFTYITKPKHCPYTKTFDTNDSE